MIGFAIHRIIWDVLNDWRDHDGCEAEVLNVVEIVNNACPRLSTILVQIAGRVRRGCRPRKPVGDDLLHGNVNHLARRYQYHVSLEKWRDYEHIWISQTVALEPHRLPKSC